MIRGENLSFSFGTLQAVRNCSFTVSPGEIYGLLGPDGAGKTTLLRMIAGILNPREGTLHRHYATLGEFQNHLGYMPQHFSLYEDCTVRENLHLMGRLYGLSSRECARRSGELLEMMDLAPFARRLGGNLSGGMKQKLSLGALLMHGPEILVLDEPGTGVDPVSRREFWRILYGLNREGTTILLSTPYMDEALLCSRVGFLFRGRLLLQGTPGEIPGAYPHTLFRLSSRKIRHLSELCKTLPGVQTVNPFGDALHVGTREPENFLRTLETRRKDLPSLEIEKIEPELEDVFVELSSRKEVLP